MIVHFQRRANLTGLRLLFVLKKNLSAVSGQNRTATCQIVIDTDYGIIQSKT